MTLRSQILTDLDVFLDEDEFAQEVTYAGQTVTAVFENDDLSPITGIDARKAVLRVKVSDLSSEPLYDDTAVIDGDTWRTYRDDDDNAYYLSEGMYLINIKIEERFF